MQQRDVVELHPGYSPGSICQALRVEGVYMADRRLRQRMHQRPVADAYVRKRPRCIRKVLVVELVHAAHCRRRDRIKERAMLILHDRERPRNVGQAPAAHLGHPVHGSRGHRRKQRIGAHTQACECPESVTQILRRSLPSISRRRCHQRFGRKEAMGVALLDPSRHIGNVLRAGYRRLLRRRHENTQHRRAALVLHRGTQPAKVRHGLCVNHLDTTSRRRTKCSCRVRALELQLGGTLRPVGGLLRRKIQALRYASPHNRFQHNFAEEGRLPAQPSSVCQGLCIALAGACKWLSKDLSNQDSV
mmetsp:Transcript_139829/g.446138  ORF Transcript_139829/g.446138 Transcript_139829/m.446138 type:complete len:303 (-) Transcript_139829:965-1873(-)